MCEMWDDLASGGRCEGMGWEGLREDVRLHSSVGSNRSTSASMTDGLQCKVASQWTTAEPDAHTCESPAPRVYLQLVT